MTQQIDPAQLAAFRRAVRANIQREIEEERAEAEQTRAEVLAQLAAFRRAVRANIQRELEEERAVDDLSDPALGGG
jgi:Arc/MetJ family transcription regulator